MKKPLLIAIDGPSASGKGSLAQKLAVHFGLPHLNTGALYRAVALRLAGRGFGTDDFEAKIGEDLARNDGNLVNRGEDLARNSENLANYDKKPPFLEKSDKEFGENNSSFINELTTNLADDDLENDALFSEKTGEIASKIAKNPLLRRVLVKIQRDFIENGILAHGGAVLDGRDIASKIMPEAGYKFFITANVEERAKRRFKQLCDKGDDVSYDEILAQLKARDESDKNRANSPLVIDENAIIIDNGNLQAQETFAKALEFIK